MRKKVLYVALIWLLVAVTVFVLYLKREVSLVKEFIAWALTVWQILAALGGVALLISGLVIKHDFGLKKNQEHEEQMPRLELSDPMTVPRYPETVMHDGKPWRVEVDLWRVSLTNTQQNSQASNVSIQVTRSKPSINMLPIILHERNDNTQPYKRSWLLRYGETLVFDVIGFQTLAIDRDSERPIGLLYLYRSDSGDSAIPCEIPAKEVTRAMRRNGVVLTIAVFADLPAKGTTRKYRACINQQKQFVLEPYGKTNSR